MQIDELIERVEKGEGADRGLDCDIGCAVDDWTSHPTFGMAGNNYVLYRHKGLASQMPAFTTSLDAVLALIEEKLPGTFGDVDLGALPADQSLYGARIFSANWDPWKNVGAEASSPARALLAAFLRAHKEQHDGR